MTAFRSGHRDPEVESRIATAVRHGLQRPLLLCLAEVVVHAGVQVAGSASSRSLFTSWSGGQEPVPPKIPAHSATTRCRARLRSACPAIAASGAAPGAPEAVHRPLGAPPAAARPPPGSRRRPDHSRAALAARRPQPHPLHGEPKPYRCALTRSRSFLPRRSHRPPANRPSTAATMSITLAPPGGNRLPSASRASERFAEIEQAEWPAPTSRPRTR